MLGFCWRLLSPSLVFLVAWSFFFLYFFRAGEADMSFALVGLLVEFFKSSCLLSSNVWVIRKPFIGVWIFLDVVGVTIFLELG